MIRVMKARRRVRHEELVLAVVEQTKGRGVLEGGEIKRNIERYVLCDLRVKGKGKGDGNGANDCGGIG